MKKLMVLASMAFVLLLAGGALAGVPCPGCDGFAGDFTIQAVPNTAITCAEGRYAVDLIITNDTGSELTNVKVQGGLAAWVTFVANDGSSCSSTSGIDLVKNLPNDPQNKGKTNAPKNKNQIMQYTTNLPIGVTTLRVVVSGDPGEFECPDSPNVIGNWSASAMSGDVAVEAQAKNQAGDLLWETCPDVPSAEACVPETDADEVFVCDFEVAV